MGATLASGSVLSKPRPSRFPRPPSPPQATVLGHARDPARKKQDPQGIRLAQESAGHSSWARDVAAERGMKYTQMKRGEGRGGGLLALTKTTGNRGKAVRGFGLSLRAEQEAEGGAVRRGSVLRGGSASRLGAA